MAYNSYNKIWESEFDGVVSKRDKLQDLNTNQLKLEYMILIRKMKKYQQTFNLSMTQTL